MASRTDIEWSVDRFNKFLNRFVEATGINGALALKRFSTEAVSRMVARTPVDTGVARYGWKAAGDALGVRVPNPGPRANADNIDPGEYEEQLSGSRKLIHWANNVPYVIYLEYGWSKQAPLGMVRITLAELRAGENLSQGLMDGLRDAWEETKGRSRYRAQEVIMRGVLGAARDMNLTRRPKPDIVRNRRRPR